MTTNVGTFNGGGSAQGNLKMTGNNSRAGAPDLGQAFGQQLSGRELAMRQHYVAPSNDEISMGQTGQGTMRSRSDAINGGQPLTGNNALPPYYNNYDGLPVPYSAPDGMKENFMLRSTLAMRLKPLLNS